MEVSVEGWLGCAHGVPRSVVEDAGFGELLVDAALVWVEAAVEQSACVAVRGVHRHEAEVVTAGVEDRGQAGERVTF